MTLSIEASLISVTSRWAIAAHLLVHVALAIWAAATTDEPVFLLARLP